MATCKYFLQGKCRYAQYCRFSHTGNAIYGDNSTLGNKPPFKTIALAVAEEVLAIERGGQWPLSCFGPFKERPCVPGMEDFSPDEFHWKIYQAQKTGTVDQAKLQFQQLCQTMKARRDLLKNPTLEVAAMLEALQKGEGQETAFGGNNSLAKSSSSSPSFPFAALQMETASSSAPTPNLFTSEPFNTMNTSNPFGGTTSTFGSAGSTPFGFSSQANAAPFGSKSTFGGTPAFGNSANPALPFGSTAKSTASVFGGANQNAPSFGTTTTQQTVSTFNAPPAFGQTTAFSTSNQESTPFGRIASTQSIAIFGSTTTSTNSVFGGAATIQPTSNSIFGGNQSASAPLFGASPQQSSSGIFGGSASAPGNTVQVSPFSQPKANAAFGGGPVFGGTPSFQGVQTNPGIFGVAQQQQQSAFGGVGASTSNLFGGSGGGNAVTPTFGSIGQSTPGTFGSVVKSPSTNFGNAQNPPPFGAQISTAGPFGSAVSTANSPFITSAGPFSAATATAAPFSGSNIFATTGQSINATATFGTTPTQSQGAAFGTLNATDAPLYGQASSPFGGSVTNSPFSNAVGTVTTASSSPFGSQSQAVDNSPFRGATGSNNQGSSVFGSSQATPFSNSPFALMHKELEVLDETDFTIDSQLTDDEKAMYLATQFVLGKIPLKPPTKELR